MRQQVWVRGVHLNIYIYVAYIHTYVGSLSEFCNDTWGKIRFISQIKMQRRAYIQVFIKPAIVFGMAER